MSQPGVALANAAMRRFKEYIVLVKNYNTITILLALFFNTPYCFFRSCVEMVRHNKQLEVDMTKENTDELPKHNGCSSTEKEMDAIRIFVHNYRKKYGITPTPGSKPEGSCFCFGEGPNLLYRQLVLTTEGDGDWPALKDAAIRKLVIDEIASTEKE